MSVLEIAEVDVAAGHEAAFERDLAEAAATLLPQAQGFEEFTALGWCVERPSVFSFTIRWATLADHVEGFRGSDLFTQWRALIGPHFAAAPVVEHYSTR